MICSSLTPTLAVSTVRPAATVAVTPHRARRPAPEKRATLLVACAPLTTRRTIGRNDAASANQVPTLADALSSGADDGEHLLGVIDGAHVEMALEDLVEGPVERAGDGGRQPVREGLQTDRADDRQPPGASSTAAGRLLG